MIAYLKGEILKKTDRAIILKTDNIGYLVHITENNLQELREGQKLECFIHHYQTENNSDLYGFLNHEQLELFKTLILVNGVGAKVASEILNAPVAKIKEAIVSEDIEYLRKIPGIGPKTAKRIVFELMGKIDATKIVRKQNKIYDDAVEALSSLGYQKQEIIIKLGKIPADLGSVEEIITHFLKYA